MARRKVEIDPALAAVLTEGDQRARWRGMTKGQRAQAMRDAERTRVTLELDPQIVRMVKRIAMLEGCSPAGVVNLFVERSLADYVYEGLEFHGHRRPSRSPRYEWVVQVGDLDGMEGDLEDLEKRDSAGD